MEPYRYNGYTTNRPLGKSRSESAAFNDFSSNYVAQVMSKPVDSREGGSARIMSQSFDCRFTDGNRNVLRLGADLSLGWQDLGDAWGFDSAGILHYEIQSDFLCRLRLVAKAPESCEARTRFPELNYMEQLAIGNNSCMIFGPRLMVGIPLDQVWQRAEEEPHPPSLYAIESSLFSVDTPEGNIPYQLEIWISLQGVTHRFTRVENQYEWGERNDRPQFPTETDQQKLHKKMLKIAGRTS